jgi:hypothetical protein
VEIKKRLNKFEGVSRGLLAERQGLTHLYKGKSIKAQFSNDLLEEYYISQVNYCKSMQLNVCRVIYLVSCDVTPYGFVLINVHVVEDSSSYIAN